MIAVTFVVTDAGRAALVNAANTGTAPVEIAQVGLTNTAFVAAKAQTVLAGEHRRLAVRAGDVVAPDTIHVVARDETDDVYSVRGLGLYLADGTLFAAYGQAGSLFEKSASAVFLLNVDLKFADVAAAELTFGAFDFVNPPATETVKGVVELATEAETLALADGERAVTPKGLKGVWDALVAAIAGKVAKAGDTMSGLLTLNAGLLAANGPVSLPTAPVIRRAGGQVGGELRLERPNTGTGLTADVVLDVFQNRFRVRELASGKGFHIDLLTLPDGATARAWTTADFDPAAKVNKTGDILTGGLTINRTTPGSTDVFGFRRNNVTRAFVRMDDGDNLELDGFEFVRSRKPIQELFGGAWRPVWHAGNFDPTSRVSRAGDVLTGGLTIDWTVGGPSDPIGFRRNGALQAFARLDDGDNLELSGKTFVRSAKPLQVLDGVTYRTVWHAGTFDPATKSDVGHTHDAAQVTAGVFDPARIPALPISRTAGLQAALDASLRLATTDQTGQIEIATAAEAVAGEDDARALTPAGLAAFPRSMGASGYARIPGTPLIVQWGSYAGGSATPNFVFPTAFPNACLHVGLSGRGTGATNSGITPMHHVRAGSVSATGFGVQCVRDDYDFSRADTAADLTWFAWGF